MVPFLGTLNIRGRIIMGIQKGTRILTTNHMQTAGASNLVVFVIANPRLPYHSGKSQNSSSLSSKLPPTITHNIPEIKCCNQPQNDKLMGAYPTFFKHNMDRPDTLTTKLHTANSFYFGTQTPNPLFQTFRWPVTYVKQLTTYVHVKPLPTNLPPPKSPGPRLSPLYTGKDCEARAHLPTAARLAADQAEKLAFRA